MVYIREGIERDGMEREGMEREKEWRENMTMNYHDTCIRDLLSEIFVVKSISDFTGYGRQGKAATQNSQE